VPTRLGLSAREYATLARLTTPERIQAFINAIPANHEPGGETVHSGAQRDASPRGALHRRRARRRVRAGDSTASLRS
jgi:hypothetical protein